MSQLKTYAITTGRFLKVGKATNVDVRMRSLQTSNPERLELLAAVDRDIEREVHESLERADVRRMVGEWFVDCSQSRDVLRSFGLCPQVSPSPEETHRTELADAFRDGLELGWLRAFDHVRESMSVDLDDSEGSEI